MYIKGDKYISNTTSRWETNLPNQHNTAVPTDQQLQGET